MKNNDIEETDETLCQECGGELTPGYTEHLGEGHTQVWRTCKECGTEVQTT